MTLLHFQIRARNTLSVSGPYSQRFVVASKYLRTRTAYYVNFFISTDSTLCNMCRKLKTILRILRVALKHIQVALHPTIVKVSLQVLFTCN